MIKDITNLKFNKLIARLCVRISDSRRAVWLWECDCGNYKEFTSNSVLTGNIISCGCARQGLENDRRGVLWGKLIPYHRIRLDNGRYYWKCVCTACGKLEHLVHPSNFKNTHTCGCERIKSGSENYQWKGGKSSISELIRKSDRYKEWRTAVYQRDGYVCQMCYEPTKRNIHAHHIKHLSILIKESGVKTIVEAEETAVFWNIANGLTLCSDCHTIAHDGRHVFRGTPRKDNAVI